MEFIYFIISAIALLIGSISRIGSILGKNLFDKPRMIFRMIV